jgi:hypothetical protein
MLAFSKGEGSPRVAHTPTRLRCRCIPKCELFERRNSAGKESMWLVIDQWTAGLPCWSCTALLFDRGLGHTQIYMRCNPSAA